MAETTGLSLVQCRFDPYRSYNVALVLTGSTLGCNPTSGGSNPSSYTKPA